jgi:hypothetical protein
VDISEYVGSGLVAEGFDEIDGKDTVDGYQRHEKVVSFIVDEQGQILKSLCYYFSVINGRNC